MIGLAVAGYSKYRGIIKHINLTEEHYMLFAHANLIASSA